MLGIDKPKILGVFCHPDDEILAGWSIFQRQDIEKHLMICCGDFSRKGARRENALKEVCQQENINLYCCLDEDNNFYALPTRRADYLLIEAVCNIESWLGKAITEIDPDYVMTHSVCGEYGHGSHRLLFEIVTQHHLIEKTIITDICQESNHRSHKSIPPTVRKAYYGRRMWAEGIQNLNMDWFNRCKAIYDKHNAWSWSKPPIKHCNLFLV